jgi:hypothetical protein
VSATATLRRRPSLAAAVLYAVLALAFVAPALVPGRTLASTDVLWSIAPWANERPDGVRELGANWEMADAVAQFQPFLAYQRSRLPDIALWNPYIEGGRPLHANMQSAIFSPFSWPAYVLPFWWSLGLIGALKLWVPAFGTFLLARALGQKVGGALLAGLVAGFGLFHVVWLAWPLSSVWAWLPWVLLLTDRVVRRPSAPAFAGLALVVALQYTGGHPETSFHVLAAAFLFALLRGPRRLPLFLGGVAAGTGLAAIVLVPFVELLAYSSDLANRAGRDPARTPIRFGLALALPDYWGRPTQLESEPFIVTRAFYAGALPLLLAAVTLLRPTKEKVAIAATGAVALLVVLGVQPFFGVANHLPGFSQAHNTRLAIVTLLCIALLAGWGLDGVKRSRWLTALVAFIVVAPVLAGLARAGAYPLGDALKTAWGFVTPTDTAVLPLASILIWIPFAVAAGALILLRPRWFVAAAITLTALDLARAGMGQNPAIPVAHAETPRTGAMKAIGDERFVAVGGSNAGITPFTANIAMRYGMRDGRGYDYPTDKRYDELWRRSVAKPDPLGLTLPSTQASATPAALRAMGLLGVSRIMQPPGEPPLPLREVYSGPDARVYENPYALPRVFVVGSELVTDDQLGAVTAPGFDPRKTAVVSKPTDLSAGGFAHLTSDEPERVVVQSWTRNRALLVLADTWFPGWQAKIDGREVPIIRTDQMLRGVVIPYGLHTVEFTYRPLSWRIGWIVSLLTAVALVSAAAWRRR